MAVRDSGYEGSFSIPSPKGVFQAAQEAADMYLEAAKRQADGIEEAARRRAEEIIAKAQYGSEGE